MHSIFNTHIFVLSLLEIDCGKPPRLPNADIIWDNGTTLESTVYYKCKDGFQSFGEHNFSQCKISHKWENITFECKGKYIICYFCSDILYGWIKSNISLKSRIIFDSFSAASGAASYRTAQNGWHNLERVMLKTAAYTLTKVNISNI